MDAGNATEPHSGQAAPVPTPSRSVFSLEGRATPGLYAAGWFLTLFGIAVILTIIAGGASGLVGALIVELAFASIAVGLIAGAGSQALQRRADHVAGFAGPSPVLVFLALVACLLTLSGPLRLLESALGFASDSAAGAFLELVLNLVLYVGLVALLVVGTGALSWSEILHPRVIRPDAMKAPLAPAGTPPPGMYVPYPPQQRPSPAPHAPQQWPPQEGWGMPPQAPQQWPPQEGWGTPPQAPQQWPPREGWGTPPQPAQWGPPAQWAPPAQWGPAAQWDPPEPPHRSTAGSSPSRRLLGDALLGVGLAVPLIFVTGYLAVVLYSALGLQPGDVPPVLPSAGTTIERLLVLVAAAIVAPIGEEIFFRGYATNAWARRFSPAMAIVVAGMFFAAVHVLDVSGANASVAFRAALVAFGTRIPVALVLGWIFLRRRSLYASLSLHAAYNGILQLLTWVA